MLLDATSPYLASTVIGTKNHIRYQERPSESPLVERVWHSQADNDDSCIAIADGRWDMVFIIQDGQAKVFITGPQTTAISIPHPAGSEWLGVRFRLGVMMPHLSLNNLVNEGIHLPDAVHGSFWLNSLAWPLPNYENVDVLISRLVKNDLFSYDPVVQSAVQGQNPSYSLRALQYRFQHTVGLSFKTIQQIERAQAAVVLLQQDHPILDTAFQLGYYDQAHLINSLKRFMGRTPLQITKAMK